jgi:type III secretion system low calcium response chaperone LcrH/SycD
MKNTVRPRHGSSPSDLALAAKLLRGETSLREAQGVSDDQMAAMYARGCAQFEAGDLDAARVTMRLLAMIEPREPTYWVALGMCLQSSEAHRDAAHCFALAAALDVRDPSPHVRAARSFLALGDTDSARAALDAARAVATSSGAHAVWLAEAAAVRADLTRAGGAS